MVQDELLIEQLNQKQVGAFKILFDRFYRYLVLYAMKWVERQAVSYTHLTLPTNSRV